jgi:putative transposase
VRTGHKCAREISRARVLLLSNQQKMGTEIAKILGISRNTVLLIKRDMLKKAFQVLFLTNQDLVNIKYTEKHVTEVIALAYSSSPDGRKRWSLSLLTEELRTKKDLKQ